MAEHPTIEELADTAEALLGASRAAEVDAHLAGCAECRELAADLAEVTAVLRAEPAPGPMPAAIAGRLGAVVAGEQRRRAGSSAADDQSGRLAEVVPFRARESLGPLRVPIRRSRWRRIAAPALAAAAAAGVVGFGAYVVSATAGLNEPPTLATVITTDQLRTEARALEVTYDPTPHRFSRAWQCARVVTDGRITGIAGSTVNGEPALLVYTGGGGDERVTVVTGCGRGSPVAGASVELDR